MTETFNDRKMKQRMLRLILRLIFLSQNLSVQRVSALHYHRLT